MLKGSQSRQKSSANAGQRAGRRAKIRAGFQTDGLKRFVAKPPARKKYRRVAAPESDKAASLRLGDADGRDRTVRLSGDSVLRHHDRFKKFTDWDWRLIQSTIDGANQDNYWRNWVAGKSRKRVLWHGQENENARPFVVSFHETQFGEIYLQSAYWSKWPHIRNVRRRSIKGKL